MVVMKLFADPAALVDSEEADVAIDCPLAGIGIMLVGAAPDAAAPDAAAPDAAATLVWDGCAEPASVVELAAPPVEKANDVVAGSGDGPDEAVCKAVPELCAAASVAAVDVAAAV